MVNYCRAEPGECWTGHWLARRDGRWLTVAEQSLESSRSGHFARSPQMEETDLKAGKDIVMTDA